MTAALAMDWTRTNETHPGPACAGADPETFFPPQVPRLIERAKTYCRVCPVVRDCLIEALTHDVDGVWGGTTYQERDRLRRKARLTAKPLRIEDRGGVLTALRDRSGSPPALPTQPAALPTLPRRSSSRPPHPTSRTTED